MSETSVEPYTDITESNLILAADAWVIARNAASRDDYRNGELNRRQDHAMMRMDYLLDKMFDATLEPPTEELDIAA